MPQKITRANVENLTHGTILHHVINKNSDGTPQRWRVNGEVKVWKRKPEAFRVPIKHGLYSYGYLTESTAFLLVIPD